MGIVDIKARATEPSDKTSLSWGARSLHHSFGGKPSRAPIRNSLEPYNGYISKKYLFCLVLKMHVCMWAYVKGRRRNNHSLQKSCPITLLS